MTLPKLDCMALMNGIENFVSEFDRIQLYDHFGPVTGQELLDEFGAQLSALGPVNQPLDCFYHFIVKIQNRPDNLAEQVNKVFAGYYVSQCPGEI